jgi:hypothetical protein
MAGGIYVVVGKLGKSPESIRILLEDERFEMVKSIRIFLYPHTYKQSRRQDAMVLSA